MFISKNLLVGLVAASISFGMGNDRMVIAQNAPKSTRYVSDQEIQVLIKDSLTRVAGGNRFFQERRSPSEISEINDFVNAWQKVDPSIAPFIGDWGGWEESLSIYPSQTKGQMCLVLSYYTGYGGSPRTSNEFSLGKVSGNKLLVIGERGKQVILKERGSVKSGKSIDFLAIFGVYDRRTESGEFVNRKLLREVRNGKLTEFGCTSSLPSNNQTQVSTQNQISTQKKRAALNNVLTSQQRNLLDSTGIKIFVPDYIPNGFQVHEVKTYRGSIARGYGIIYRDKTKDTCFAIESITGGIGGRLGGEYAYSYPISTRLFGNSSVIFTSDSFLDMRRQNIPSEAQKRSPQKYLGTEWARNTSVSSSFYRLIGADFVGQSYYGARRNQAAGICRNDITPLEAEKIIKSLRSIDAPSVSVSVPSVPPSSIPVKPTDMIVQYLTKNDFNTKDTFNTFEEKLQNKDKAIATPPKNNS